VTPLLPALLLAFASGDVTPAIDRAVPSADVNYLVIDARTREIVAARWPESTIAVPVGSLVKPFTALAYSGEFPSQVACAQGKLGFVDALAQSCNDYFLQLASKVDGGSLSLIAGSFGISAPSAQDPETRVGLGDKWRIVPLSLALAYTDLSKRRGDARVDLILRGMEGAAVSGTAKTIGKLDGIRILAKTGTAPCIANRPHAGDGFTLAMYPAESPRYTVLVRVHNVPGAEAAKSAGRVLRVLTRK
jgi:hypothetical protein